MNQKPVSSKAQSRKNTLIVIVGPTASGKTDLAIEVASDLSGEIICADSRTIYKSMDIGTAKPTNIQQQSVPHHCLDLVTPDQKFTVLDFKEFASRLISNIHERHKVPIIVGGSGLYVDSVIYDYSFPDSIGDNKLDDLSLAELQKLSIEHNYKVPEQVFMNKRHLAGLIKRQGLIGDKKLLKNTILVGLNPGKETLENRITNRVENMLKSGFIDEVKGLLQQYGEQLTSLNAPGYRPIISYLKAEIKFDQAKEIFIKNDKDLAKRQITWFKRNDQIKWFSEPKEAKSYIMKQWS